MNSRRRSTIALRIFLGVAALATLLPACSRRSESGPEAVAYDRDACERCRMLISDPRFAAEVRLPGEGRVHKFDDLGDALAWLAERPPRVTPPGRKDAGTEIWVRDADQDRWLDATRASYSRGAKTPMNFGFAAHEKPAPGRLDFDQVRAEVGRIAEERRSGR